MRSSDEIFGAVIAEGRRRRRRWGAAAGASLLAIAAVPILASLGGEDEPLIVTEGVTTTASVPGELERAARACEAVSDEIDAPHGAPDLVLPMTIGGIVRDFVPASAIAAWQALDPTTPVVQCSFALHECEDPRAISAIQHVFIITDQSRVDFGEPQPMDCATYASPPDGMLTPPETSSTASGDSSAIPADGATVLSGDVVLTNAHSQMPDPIRVAVGSTITVRLEPRQEESGQNAIGAAQTNRQEIVARQSASEDPATGRSEAVFQVVAPGEAQLVAGEACADNPPGVRCRAVAYWLVRIEAVPASG